MPYNKNLVFQIDRISFNNEKQDERHYKLLGIFLDEHLTFEKHINNLCSKLSKALYFLRSSKNFLSKTALRSLYFALFHPHLLYCISITSCATKTKLAKITLLQKKAIRIISGAKYRDHTEELFLNQNILPFEKLIIQSKLLFMHAIYYKYSHFSFDGVWSKNSELNPNLNLRNKDDIKLPAVNLEIFRRLPFYSFAKEWNELGDSTFQANPITFSIELKNRLRENSLSVLTEVT